MVWDISGRRKKAAWNLQTPGPEWTRTSNIVHRINSMRSRGADRQLGPKRSLAELTEGEAQSSTSADVCHLGSVTGGRAQVFKCMLEKGTLRCRGNNNLPQLNSGSFL